MDELEEIIKEFLVESYENLDQLDRDLVALEDQPDDRNRLSSVFRTIHTIKGTCGFLGFPILEHVTHVGESLLVRLRDAELRLNGEITDGLLAMVDAVRTVLSNIANSRTEGTDHYEALVERLEQLRTGQSPRPLAVVAMPEQADSSVNHDAASLTSEQRMESRFDELEAMVTELTMPEPTVSKTRKKKTAANKAKAVTKSKAKETPITAAAIPNAQLLQTTDELPSMPMVQAATMAPAGPFPTEPPQIAATYIPKPNTVCATANTVDHESSSDFGDKSHVVAETTVRLDVSLLDRLMNLVGELVLARNQIMQFSQATHNAPLIAASQRLNLITTELQEGVMTTRMQPIRNAWNKLPRVIRDLSQTCGKKVNVEMEGADTELDKTILEAIKDPLTHIVRNSVDHGIETPEVRQANGKPAEGTLLLRAFHEGGQVNIEISDDGGGIHRDRVRAKAIEKGLITSEQAAGMSDREVMNLILLPGFSTAAKVTNVSGRGVGMDVVKTNVERIGGTLEISSVEGQGTTLRIKIPLTLAIIPALVATCGGDRYCIPQVSLLELVRLEGHRARTEIELMHSVPIYRLRGQLLPIIYLDEELGLRPRRTESERRQAEIINIVVLQAEDRQFGLVVDHISDTQEIVVKPLGQHLKGVGIYAGSTIMGDGTVSLILDVIGLARQGHVVAERGIRPPHDSGAGRSDGQNTRQTYLIVDPGDGSRSAIKLSAVARLEEFPADQVERSGHQAVVQYRGKIMPLVSANGGSGGTCESGSTLSVVVFERAHRHVGVIVARILDIVEHDAGTDDGNQPVSPQIISGRVTQVIDPAMLVGA